MKKISRSFLIVMALVAMLISACGGAAASATETSSGSTKPRASMVEFTGVIEAMDGNQWTINGQVISVDDSILRDGPYSIGDTVKVEAEVQQDGSIVVTRVERPSQDDDNSNDDGNLNANGNANDNSNANSNSNGNTNSNSNDDDSSNSNDDDSNSNDDDSNNSNDDSSNSNSGGGQNSNDDDDNGGNDNDDDDDNDNDD